MKSKKYVVMVAVLLVFRGAVLSQEQPRAVFEATVKDKKENPVTGVSWQASSIDWVCMVYFLCVEVGVIHFIYS